MVVADENAHAGGPAKKRPRLSLKERRHAPRDESLGQEDFGTQVAEYQGLTPLDINQPLTQDEGDGEAVTEVNNDSDCPMLSSGFLSELPKIPPVASLENIGNTCYLNSMLEILRYTPGFLVGLEQFYKTIVEVENKMKELQLEDEEVEELKPCVELPKQLYQLYKRMERMEERYAEVASSDVSSMAVKPDKVLNVIRKINGMFEGCLQHDAQELLHCLLGSLQEGEDELHKIQVMLMDKEMALSLQDSFKDTEPHLTSPKRSPRLNKQVSPLKVTPKLPVRRQIFGPSKPVPSPDKENVTVEACSKSAVGDLGEEKCSTPTAALVNGEGPLPLESQSAHCLQEETSQAPAARKSLSENCQPPSPKKGRPGRRGRRPAPHGPKRRLVREFEESAFHQNQQGAKNVLCDGLSQRTITSMFSRINVQSYRRPPIRGSTASQVGEPPLSEGGSAPQVVPGSLEVNGDVGSDHAGRSDNVDGHTEGTETSSSELPDSSGIATGPQSKRMPSPSSRLCPSSPPSTPVSRLQTGTQGSSGGESPLTENCSPAKQFTSITSPSKRRIPLSSSFNSISPSLGISGLANFTQTSTTTTTSSNGGHLQPMLKLEKCDFVCRRWGQSVNFQEAMRHLSPTKSQQGRRSGGAAGTFSGVSSYGATSTFTSVPMKTALVKVEKCDSVCGSPAKSVDAKYAERCLSGTTVPKREFVKQLFLGTMYLRTRCLECETCRDRVEEFQDISVPLRNEQPKRRPKTIGANEPDKKPSVVSSENENSCLSKLMSAFSAVELLSGDNKYNCGVCKQMTEAERSIHYKSIPDILVLQLKRFSASAGCFASLSKINDHVEIPLTLPCLRQCVKPCPNPEHRYVLFGVVTHAGSTISNGHYLSYVKVCPNSTAQGSEVYMRIADFLHPDSEPEVEGSTPQYQWLGCDDETIRIHSEQEFHDMLSGKEGSLVGNPYVLFYHRMNHQLGSSSSSSS